MVENLLREKGEGNEDESSWYIALLSKLIIGLEDKFPKTSIAGPKLLSETQKWIDTYSETILKDSSPEKILETNLTTAFIVQNNLEEILNFIDEIERISYETLGTDLLIDTIKLVDEKNQTPQRILLRFNHPREKDSKIHILVDISKTKPFGKFIVKIGGLTLKDDSNLERK